MFMIEPQKKNKLSFISFLTAPDQKRTKKEADQKQNPVALLL